jgi:hypothetical protein
MTDDPHLLDPDYDRHGGFPNFEAAQPGPGFARFLTAMRRAQDLAVSADPDTDTWEQAADRAEELVKLLGPFEAPEGVGPANRVPSLPGAGSLLMPPYRVLKFGPDGVELSVQFSRFSVGGNYAVHGGVLPLLFDSALRLGVRHGHSRGRPSDQPHGFPARRLPEGDTDRHAADCARLGARGPGPQGIRQRRTA